MGEEDQDLPHTCTPILRSTFLLTAAESLGKICPPMRERKGMFKEQTE